MGAIGGRWNAWTACTLRPATTSLCNGAFSMACTALKAAPRANTKWRGLCCPCRPAAPTGWRTPRLPNAVERFLEREGQGVDAYLQSLHERTPFQNQNCSLTPRKKPVQRTRLRVNGRAASRHRPCAGSDNGLCCFRTTPVSIIGCHRRLGRGRGTVGYLPRRRSCCLLGSGGTCHFYLPVPSARWITAAPTFCEALEKPVLLSNCFSASE